VGEPRVLFEGSYETMGLAGFGTRANYDVTPDGQRFLMVRAAGAEANAAPRRPKIHIVLNCFDELRARVP
jgi:hypothetical protein